jgi:hypothetical protein
VNNLESDLNDFKDQVAFKLIYELKKSFHSLIENNVRVCPKNEGIVKEMNDFLHGSDVNKEVNQACYVLIKKVFNIISISSYENLHNYLRNH